MEGWNGMGINWLIYHCFPTMNSTHKLIRDTDVGSFIADEDLA
jgi:hypothetical protein